MILVLVIGRFFTRKEINITLNYGNDEISEEYVHEGWRLYMIDGLPTKIVRIDKDNRGKADEKLAGINLEKECFHGEWNYKISSQY